MWTDSQHLEYLLAASAKIWGLHPDQAWLVLQGLGFDNYSAEPRRPADWTNRATDSLWGWLRCRHSHLILSVRYGIHPSLAHLPQPQAVKISFPSVEACRTARDSLQEVGWELLAADRLRGRPTLDGAEFVLYFDCAEDSEAYLLLDERDSREEEP